MKNIFSTISLRISTYLSLYNSFTLSHIHSSLYLTCRTLRAHNETRYKYMIKKFYHRINKREIFQTQLIEHNKRRLNVLALKNLKRDMKENFRSKKIEFTHTRASRNSLNLKLIEIASRSINQHSQRNFSRDSIHWCSIQELDVQILISNLMSIAIVFVRKKRLKRTKETLNSRINF